jgi:hypothetical protein
MLDKFSRLCRFDQMANPVCDQRDLRSTVARPESTGNRSTATGFDLDRQPRPLDRLQRMIDRDLRPHRALAIYHAIITANSQ